jgi:arylsulfatase A-like enzyme
MKYPRPAGFRRFFWTAALLPTTLLGAAVPLSATDTPLPAVTPEVVTAAPRLVEPAALSRVSNHVIVISIDGLRPDAIEKYDATTIERLMKEGSYTLQAQTILPSLTLPSHTSMLTGVEPAQHGIDWNSDEVDTHGLVKVPTIFSVAHEAGLSTAAFFGKSKFHHLELPGSLDHAQLPTPQADKLNASQTTAAVDAYLKENRPNLMFVHIGEPDYAGHFWGWMSWFYGRAVKKADAAVASVIQSADRAYGPGNYTVILTADHGGHGRTHGTDDPRDTTIPWITWGKSVQAGTVLPEGVRTMDTAATALWLLGLELPAPRIGTPVTVAYGAEQGATVAVAR